MPPPALVDSHCHLDFPDFAGEIDAVVARAAAAGVTRMVTICTRLRQAREVRAIAEAHPGVFWAAGTHPLHVAEEPMATVEALVALARAPEARRHRRDRPRLPLHRRDRRRCRPRACAVHIEAARRTGLPLIVHARDADADIGRILAEEHAAGAVRRVMHCFTAAARARRDRARARLLSLDLGHRHLPQRRRPARDLRRRAARPAARRDRQPLPRAAAAPRQAQRAGLYRRHRPGHRRQPRGRPRPDFAALTSANFDRLFAKAAARSRA